MTTPDFVLHLRERVGHEPLWLMSATAVVIDASKLLLVRASGSGEWGPVGGIVEPGEHPATCAEREVREETEVMAEVERCVSIGVSPEYTYANGDRAQFVNHVFRLRYVSGDPAVGDDESTDVGWFPVHDLPPMPQRYLDRIARALDPRIDTLMVRDREG